MFTWESEWVGLLVFGSECPCDEVNIVYTFTVVLRIGEELQPSFMHEAWLLVVTCMEEGE